MYWSLVGAYINLIFYSHAYTIAGTYTQAPSASY